MEAHIPKGEQVKVLLDGLEKNTVPDFQLRQLIRLAMAQRLRWGYKISAQQQLSDLTNFANSLKQMKMSVATDHPDSQHYEVPTSFMKLVLGKKLKYSSCYFKDDSTTLDEAEVAMLELYCERAQIQDGQKILDIGCGWGSFVLYAAQKYHNCHFTGITNSKVQRDYVMEQCRFLKLSNVEVILIDLSNFQSEAKFDRIITIEVIEHIKNFQQLFKMFSEWLKPDGLFFLEYLCHKTFAYHLEPMDVDDWISTYVFPEGMMLALNLPLYFQDDISVVDHWIVNGKNFAKAGIKWLERLDKNVAALEPIMESTYGSKEGGVKCLAYWRYSLIILAEQFSYNDGEEWMMGHLLFKKK